MKFKTEIHLALLVIYSIAVNFKNQSNYIDGIIIVSLLVSLLYQKYLEHNTLPDIRGEVESSLNAFKAELEGKFNSESKELKEQISKLEKEAADMKNAVAPILSGRSLRVGNDQIRF